MINIKSVVSLAKRIINCKAIVIINYYQIVISKVFYLSTKKIKMLF